MPESINKVVRLRFLKKKFSTKYLLIKTFYFRVPNKRPPPRLFFLKKIHPPPPPPPPPPFFFQKNFPPPPPPPSPASACSDPSAYLILPNVPTPAPLLRPPVYSGPKSM